MKENFLNVGSRIKKLLDEKELKQIDACKLANISKNAMSNYINGNRIPDTASLYKLSKLLDSSMEWILTGEGEDTKLSSSNTPNNNFTNCNHVDTKQQTEAFHVTNNLIEVTEDDNNFIYKYNQLSRNDKEEIKAILNIKFDRISFKKEKSSQTSQSKGEVTKELA